MLSINRRNTDEWIWKQKNESWHEIKSLDDESNLWLNLRVLLAQINQWKSKQQPKMSMTFFLFLFLSLFLSFFLFPYSFNWGQSYQYCYRIFNQFQKVIGKSLTIINNQPHIYRSYIITLNIYIPISLYSHTVKLPIISAPQRFTRVRIRMKNIRIDYLQRSLIA